MEEIEKFLQQFKHCRKVKLREEVWNELLRKGVTSYRKEMEANCNSFSTMDSIRKRYSFLMSKKFEYVHLEGRTLFYKEGS